MRHMSEDIPYRLSAANQYLNIQVAPKINNGALVSVEDMLIET